MHISVHSILKSRELSRQIFLRTGEPDEEGNIECPHNLTVRPEGCYIFGLSSQSWSAGGPQSHSAGNAGNDLSWIALPEDDRASLAGVARSPAWRLLHRDVLRLPRPVK